MGIYISALYTTYFMLSFYAFYVLSWTQLFYTYILFYLLLEVAMSLFLHRWATNNLWNPPVWLQNIMSVVSMTALLGTPISYSAWHRTHHATSDTPKDPHSPKYSNWLYIIFAPHHQRTEPKRAADRMRNKWQLWLTLHEVQLVFILNGLLFLLLPIDWFLCWATAVAWTTFWVMFVTGIMCHSYGKDEPCDVPYMYPVAFSEAFHKQHHISPQLKHCKYDIWVWVITKLRWV